MKAYVVYDKVSNKYLRCGYVAYMNDDRTWGELNQAVIYQNELNAKYACDKAFVGRHNLEVTEVFITLVEDK